MVVGVNGVGKTTTIGKLAYHFKKAGKTVYLGAADTFRCSGGGAIDDLGERVDVPVVKQSMGSDPASVAYDTLASAKRKRCRCGNYRYGRTTAQQNQPDERAD